MGETQGEVDVFALFGGTIAYALDFQGFAEAVGYAFHHVVDERTGQAVQRTVFFFVIGTFHGDDTVVQGDLHRMMDLTL